MPESSWRFFLTFMVAAAEVLVGACVLAAPLSKKHKTEELSRFFPVFVEALVGAASSLRPKIFVGLFS